MDAKEYKKHCHGAAWGKLPGEKKNRWVDAEEISKYSFFFVYGDPRGDDMLCCTETEEELLEKLKAFMEGDTGCDFTVELHLVCSRGFRVKAEVSINLTPA